MKKRLGFFALLSALVLPLSISAKTLDKDTTLAEDVNDGILVKNGSKVTLNLGGKKVTNKDGEHTITVESGATLTIIGAGDVTNTSHAKAVLYNDGNLTIEGGTYSRKNVYVAYNDPKNNDYYVVLNHGDMTINGGKFTGEGGQSSLFDNGWYTPSQNTKKIASNMTINGGTFEISGNDKYIKNDDYGVMTVNGGTFTMVKPSSAIIANVGFDSGKETVTINDGTFNYTGTNYAIWDYDWNVNGYEGKDNSTTIVNGGTYHLEDKNAKITNVKFSEKTGERKLLDSDRIIVAKEEDIKEIVKVSNRSVSEVIEQLDIEAIKKFADKKYELASFYEINLYKGLDEDTLFEGTEMETSDSAKVITLSIPTSLKAVQDGYKRTYYVVRSHMVDNEYKVDVLDTTLNEDGTVSFKTDKFSTYALAYTDTKVEKAEVKNPNTADNGLLYMVLSGLGLVSIAFVSKSLIKH